MNKQTSNEILGTLRDLISNPKCELNFNNPYELIIAVSLSAQTTDKRVNMITPELFRKYPTPKELALAEYEDVYSICKQLGLAKTKSRNIILLAKEISESYNGIVPNTLEELIKLPGVGRKTASVVLAVGYQIPAMPVDTHLHRMAIRLGYIKGKQDVLEAEMAYKKYIPMEDWIDAHHLLLLFGRYYCKAQTPLCENCQLKKYCKYKG